MTSTLQPEDRRVHEIMTRDAECIEARASVSHTAQRLAETGVGALPVCDEHDRVVGMITDRDIVVRVLAQGMDPATARVAEIADADPLTLEEDATLGHAAAVMRDHGVRRLPVVRGRRLVGIVGRSDLFEHAAAGRLTELERDIASEPADQRSAAWLLGRAYRDDDGRGEDRSGGRQRQRLAAQAAITGHVQDMLAGRE